MASEEQLIRLSEDQAQRLIKFYNQAEQEIMAQLNKALLKGNDTKHLKAMQANVRVILDQLLAGSRTWCEQAIPRVYMEGAQNADDMITALGGQAIKGFSGIHQQAAQILADGTFGRFQDVAGIIGRRVDDMYRALALENVRGAVIGNKSWQQVARNLRNDLADKGITGFVDKAGKKWNMSSYAEMVSRTTTMEAHLEGTKTRLLESGYNLVKISTHSNPCPKCAPWQGRILSLDGKDPGHASLDEAKAQGLFHPRCKHAYGLYIDLEDDLKNAPPKAPKKRKAAAEAPVDNDLLPTSSIGPQVFKSTKAAEKWAQENLGIDHVDYTNIFVDAANSVNQAIYEFKQRFPQVTATKWISTIQRLNSTVREERIADIMRRYKDAGYSDINPASVAKRIKADKVGGNVYAQSRGKQWGKYEGIAVNEKWFKTMVNWENLKSGVAGDIMTGWHPVGTEDPGSVITHEMGHQLHNLLRERQVDGFIKKAWADFSAEVRDGTPAKALVSRYASTKIEEFMAECIAEYLHSAAPRKYATIIGQGAEEALRGLTP